MIGSGGAFLFHFVMDADVAARVGMACGGTFDMLIEDVCSGITENSKKTKY